LLSLRCCFHERQIDTKNLGLNRGSSNRPKNLLYSGSALFNQYPRRLALSLESKPAVGLFFTRNTDVADDVFRGGFP